ncbi:MAG TPA: hypothetical protein PLN79_08005 [bacterium]|nr:hypothetical protein [bacterium]
MDPSARLIHTLIRQRSVVDAVDAGLALCRNRYYDLCITTLIVFVPLYSLKYVLFVLDLIPFERVFNSFGFFYVQSYTPVNIMVWFLDSAANTLCGAAICRYVTMTAESHTLPIRHTKLLPWGELWPLLFNTFIAELIIIIGFGLCILPGIWTGVMFMFVTPLITYEKLTSFSDIWTRSKYLSQNDWWRMLGFLLLTFLLLAILGLSLTYLFAAVYQLVLGQLAWLSGQTADENLLTMIGGAVVSVLLLPMQMVFTVVLYFDIRARREGLDIERMVQKL